MSQPRQPRMGKLADWVPRLEALAIAMREDPRLWLTFYLAKPVDEAALAQVEASWKIEAFAPAIRNLYRQANGLCLLWIASHHPLYRPVMDYQHKRGVSLGGFRTGIEPSSLPRAQDVNGFASYMWEGPGESPDGSPWWGAIYLPPLEQVMQRSGGFLNIDFGDAYKGRERTVAGKLWKGDSFERALRVFDYPDDRCSAAFVMEEGVADPRVVLAEDHNDWASGRHASFEAYMEHLLATYATIRARMDWFLGPSTDEVGPPGTSKLEDMLPPSILLAPADDGATFEITVQAVQAAGGGGEDLRAAALGQLIRSNRYKPVAKLLGLAPYNRGAKEFLPEIVAATADPKAIDSKMAAKLMRAVGQPVHTKTAYLEAFAVGLGEGDDAGAGAGAGAGETVTSSVTTCFDRSSFTAQQLDYSFASEEFAKSCLEALGVADVANVFIASTLSGANGRKQRSATITVTLSRASGLKAGDSVRSDAVPSGFVQVGDEIVRDV